MKLFNKRRISVVLMTSIILLHGVSPLLSIATTVESSTVESSTVEPTTNSNSVETPEPVTEETPVAEDQVTEPEHIDVESDYDENELSSEYQETSAQPVVKLTKKNLTGEVTIEGEILSGIEQQENDRTETHLTKLVLQCSESDDSWEDIHTFEIAGDSAAIQAEKYAFDFSKSLDEVKAGSYRLIAEYDVQEYEEDSLKRVKHHKGMFVIGEAEKENNEETPSSNKNTTNQKNSQSDDAVSSPNQTPFSGSLYTGNGLGRAIQDPVHYPDASGVLTFNYITISNIGKRTATVHASNDTSDPKISSNGTRYAVWSTSAVFMKEVIQPSNSVGGIYSLDDAAWQRVINSGNYKVSVIESVGSGRRKDRFDLSGLSPYTNYYLWFIKEVTSTVGNVTVTTRDVYCPSGTTAFTGDSNVYNPFWFQTDLPEELRVVDAPTFSNPTHNSINMDNGTYIGDIRQSPSQGILTIKGEPNPKTYTINHEYRTGGSYFGRTAGNLLPGTRYRGEVTLYDYFGNPKTTGLSEEFQTVNTVEIPDEVTERGTPTQQNDATAKINVSYGATAGGNGSHPRQSWSDVEVQLSKTGPTSGFKTLPSGEIEGQLSGTPTVDTFGTKVSFTITGLTNRRTYWVRCRVKNDSGKWSGYPTSGREFTTRSVALGVEKPTFRNPGHNKITMNNGRYTGDIRQSPNQGNLRITDGITSKNYTINHDTDTGGNYYGVDATDLIPGNRYRGEVTLTDYDGTPKTSSLSDEFQTTNTVETPYTYTLGDPPEIATEATVTLTARYGAADGNNGVHPIDSSWDTVAHSWKNVQVEISRTGEETGFSRLTDETSDGRISHLDPPVVDTINKTVSFKVSKLAIKQNYWIRCQVRNQNGMWSGYPTKGKYIRTPGLKLILNAPKFKQETATDTSIEMEGQRYFGDITQINNRGKVKVTPNRGGIWEDKVFNLPHMQEQGTNLYPQFYGNTTVSNLEPGTRYHGQVAIQDSIEEYRDSPWGGKDGIDTYFYTKNRVNDLTGPDNLGIPTGINGASATFTGIYKAADANAEYDPAHPTKVKVYLSRDGTNFNEITTSSSGPKLFEDDDINTSGKTVTFKLEELQENTHYYVKYAVVNAGGTSQESAVYEFDTLSRPPGLYINEAPDEFDFGFVDYSDSELAHSLVNTSGNALIDFENVNMNTRWILSAQLSELKVEHENLTLPGSKIRFNRSLQKTTDGTTWASADPSKFDATIGISGSPIELVSNGGSIPLYKATDIPYGKGRFQGVIPLNSVELIIPANTGVKGKTYEGKITWTLDATA